MWVHSYCNVRIFDSLTSPDLEWIWKTPPAFGFGLAGSSQHPTCDKCLAPLSSNVRQGLFVAGIALVAAYSGDLLFFEALRNDGKQGTERQALLDAA